MNRSRLFALAFLTLISRTALAGNLTVNLSPSTAVTAGAQWRVDGGNWRNSGTTVKNLSNAAHPVDYKAVTGWITPASTSVTLTNNVTTTVTGIYAQPAALAVTLTPSSGQWRVDGGAWRTSGTTATGLTAGVHTISYNALSNYNSPATETVTLPANQTTNLSRSYTAVAALTVTLTPSSASWQVDGGSWQPSGATITGLTPGAHTIAFSTVAGMLPLASESISLPAAQATSINRSYTAEAGLIVNLAPASAQWRVDGGAWQNSGTRVGQLSGGNHTVDYNAASGYTAPPSESVALVAGQTTTVTRSYTAVSAVTVNLTPSGGTWQIDGGAWQPSGTTVAGLTPGNHTIGYSSVTGMLPMPNETVNLPGAQTTSLARSYTAEAGLTVTLTPSTAQWRLDGGAWRNSGDWVGQLIAGNHTVDYSATDGYLAPGSESISLVAGQTTTVSRNYTAVSAVTVNLSPSGATWQIDGGTWQASGATVAGLTPGNHTIAYSTVTGMLPMASETVNLPGAETTSFTRSYIAEAGLAVSLTPSTTQWRVDGGVWQESGTRMGQLTAGSHTVDYNAVSGYAAPPSENVTLVAGQTTTITRNYTAVSAVTIDLTPSSATWQVDGGTWQASGATVTGLTPGNHIIAYSTVTGMLPMAGETVNLPATETTSFTRSYTAEAGLTVTLTPSTAQWRIDGGTWQESGIGVGQLTPGNHTVDYNVLSGYAAPASENVTLVAGQTTTITRNYTAVSAVTIDLTPSSGTWRVDGGNWQASGATVTGLTPGNHAIGYSTVTGMLPMSGETVNLPGAHTTSLSRSYTAEAGLVVNLVPANAQWRLDGGAWRASGERAGQLTAGNHSVEYGATAGYLTQTSETITLSAGETTTVARTYIALASLTVNLTPSTAYWELDGGTSRASGATATGLTPGNHTIVYYGQSAMISPATETITLAPGENASISRSYTPAGQIRVLLDPATAQWRVDGGEWRASNTYTGWIAQGPHLLEYSSVAERITPPAETVNVNAGQTLQISKVYAGDASLIINLIPSSGQWRFDGGAWHNSGERVAITAGGHNVEYSPVDGYTAPPVELVFPDSGETVTLSRAYTIVPARLKVNLSEPNGRWQVDTSGWHYSGETINVDPGSHTISYLNTASALAPASETLTLQSNEAVTISRDYTPAGQVQVTLNPSSAQWRVDGGTWRASATYSGLLAAGTHTLEYSAVATKVAPPSETISVVGGQNLTVSRTYAAESFLTITFTAAVGQWRVDGGAWQTSGVRVGQLAVGSHSVEYNAVSGYLAPPSETVVLTAGEQTLTRSYLRPATLTVALNQTEGQWRINNGPWQASGATLSGLRPGSYTIQFSSIAGYFAPYEEVITLAENQNKSATYYYNAQASLTVTLTPSNATWRLNGGAWQASGATIAPLWASDYTIEYSPVDGMTAPARENFFLNLGEQKTISRSYLAPPSVSVTLSPAVGQWRVDSGAWQMSGNVISNLTPGDHLIEYTDASGYITPPAETFTAGKYGPTNLTRTYRDASKAYLNVSVVPKRFAELGVAKWRVDGGAWNASGETAEVSAGSHTLEFQPVDGLDVPAPITVTATIGTVETLEATYYMPHRLRFFLASNLVNGLSTAELETRLSQYAAHLKAIWDRESAHRFVFNPATDISIVWQQPFTSPVTEPLPEYGFEIWAYADAAGTNPNGSSGGFPAFDGSGAAGVGDMHWTQIYDPSTLAAGSNELHEYWKQLEIMTRQLEHVFGAGLGGYESARQLSDMTGVAPFYSVDYLTAADPFWNAHSDFWRDPLLGSAWNNYRIDNPTTLPALLDSVRFSATSRGIIDGCLRNVAWLSPLMTVADPSRIRVIVVDANTRQPITGATVRMWHRPTSWGSPGAEEWVQPIFETPGVFQFSWTGNTQWNPFNESDNAKLLKAYAPGYQPKAQWELIYDGQRLKTVDHLDVWEITIALDPAP